MLLHLAADQILVLGGEYRYTLPYKDLERTLPDALTGRLEKHTPHTLFVINGPGSFTTLRIGTLVTNLVHTYGDPALRLYQINKVDLYTQAYKAKVLPRYVAMYIGQKKNCRRCDLETGKTEKIAVEQLPTDENYAYDWLVETGFWQDKFDVARELSFQGEHHARYFLTYSGNSYNFGAEILHLPEVKEVEARYGVEPTLD